MNRRKILKLLSFGALGISTPSIWGCVFPLKRADLTKRGPSGDRALFIKDGRDFGPIDRAIAATRQSEFSGDNPKAQHEFLWQKANALKEKGGRPKVSEEHSVVIIGGGMSGIISAYLLSHLKPLILEQAPQLGGNSKGESWHGIDYSIGAAYFMEQEPDSEIFKLFNEAGIHDLCRKKSSSDPVLFKGRLLREFWKGESDPKSKAQFEKLEKVFLDIFNGKNGRYLAAVPPESARDREELAKLDKMNFREFLEKEAGADLHPHIETLLEHYCWSTLGCGLEDISAAIAVPTYASEFGDVYIAPGGNAAIAEKFLAEFLKKSSTDQVRPSSLVVDVRVVNDGVEVTYLDRESQLHCVRAKAAIMACPKFIAKKLIDDLEPERRMAIEKLRYTSYLVANVLLNQPVSIDEYDTYILGAGTLPATTPAANSRVHRATDIVNATYAVANSHSAVLTLYRGFPYVGARSEILSPTAYSRYKSEFLTQIEKEILPPFGFKKEMIEEIRITRWGHPIPYSVPGLFTDQVFDQISKPFRDRVFFVEQDNWAAPAIETCALEALKWTPKVTALF